MEKPSATCVCVMFLGNEAPGCSQLYSCTVGMVTTAQAMEPLGPGGVWGISPLEQPFMGGCPAWSHSTGAWAVGAGGSAGAAASPETMEGAGRERGLRLQPCQAGWWHSPSPAPGVPAGIEGHRGAPAPGAGQGRRSLEAVAETDPKCCDFSQIRVISPAGKREMELVVPSPCPTGTGAPYCLFGIS